MGEPVVGVSIASVRRCLPGAVQRVVFIACVHDAEGALALRRSHRDTGGEGKPLHSGLSARTARCLCSGRRSPGASRLSTRAPHRSPPSTRDVHPLFLGLRRHRHDRGRSPTSRTPAIDLPSASCHRAVSGESHRVVPLLAGFAAFRHRDRCCACPSAVRAGARFSNRRRMGDVANRNLVDERRKPFLERRHWVVP